jgi:sarcosine oxidase
MLLLIAALACLAVFVFVATTCSSGHPVPGRAFLEYDLDDYSGWLRRRVDAPGRWDEIKTCLAATAPVCSDLNQTYTAPQAFFATWLSPMQSGCCKPPTSCVYGDGELAVWEPNAAVSLVQPALRAMQQLGREAGVEVHYGEPVLEWTATDKGVSVRTATATYTAERVVVTVGAFSNDVLHLDLPTHVERQVLANFAVDLTAERLSSIYVAAPPGDDSAPAYGCPEPDGTFKFSVPGRGNTVEPDTLTQDVTAEDVNRIVSVVRDRLPEITGDPISMTVCMWTETEDGHWLLGHHPDSERVIVGAGCNGRGFRYAPVIGAVLADLADGVAHPELHRFDLSRDHSLSAGN